MILAGMFRRFPLAVVLAFILAVPLLGDMSLNSISTNRLLVIERSSTRVSAARATLTIEPLVRTNQIFAGNYDVKVSPFFFKSETGKLEIHVSDDSLAKAQKGQSVEITGTALTDGEQVKRKVNAIAKPIDQDHGDLKVWFVANERELVFQTTYRLLER
jgi:hypothetical protein